MIQSRYGATTGRRQRDPCCPKRAITRISDGVSDGRSPSHYNIGIDVCDKWAARTPDREALVHLRADGDVERYSFGDLSRLSNRLANALAAQGIGKGARVGILLPQAPETAVAHIAVYKLGAIAVPLFVLFRRRGPALSPGQLGRRRADHGREPASPSWPRSADRLARSWPAAAVDRRSRGAGALDYPATAWSARFAKPSRRSAHGRRRPGPDHLHLGHHRAAQGRPACPARAARPPARRGAAARSCFRSRATSSGRRRTGPGSAA